MTRLEEIKKAFETINQWEISNKMVYSYIEENSTRELPKDWKAVIRRTIQQHSSDSASYLGKQDVFQSTRGIGKGYWSLREAKEIKKAPDVESFLLDHKFPKRTKQNIFRILRDTKASRNLKALYKNKCQVCDHIIEIGNFAYSEAHHLRPLGRPHNGSDSWSNMIVLCPNHHVEFDYGLIAIDPVNMNILHKDTSNIYRERFLQMDKSHTINIDSLLYHLNEIYYKD